MLRSRPSPNVRRTRLRVAADEPSSVLRLCSVSVTSFQTQTTSASFWKWLNKQWNPWCSPCETNSRDFFLLLLLSVHIAQTSPKSSRSGTTQNQLHLAHLVLTSNISGLRIMKPKPILNFNLEYKHSNIPILCPTICCIEDRSLDHKQCIVYCCGGISSHKPCTCICSHPW